MRTAVNIFWFRRDLRLHDNAGLHHALNAGLPVLPVFIFDKNILARLENKSDRRVTFIYDSLKKINNELVKHNSSLKIIHATPQEAFEKIFRDYEVKTVFTNRDYEPYATKRDAEIEILCLSHGATFKTFKDQVIFEKSEVVKDDEAPYTIFTPYSRKWKSKFSDVEIKSFDTKKYFKKFLTEKFQFPLLKSIGFKENRTFLPDPIVDKQTILHYHQHRDIPFPGKTTHVSLHLRFGTISVRQLAKRAAELNEKYLNELIWREFLMQALWHFPHVVDSPYQKKFDKISWRLDEEGFEKWCKGETGFPLVDAGMRELNETGFMHNRVRMVTANFLTKILFVDWRWGEAYFAEKLSDFELSSNNGNWQWAAGTGCDAAPYFRIFNPQTQAERLDPENKYISKWIPGYNPDKYLKPIIDFNFARKRALETFKKVLS
jgi:deoxyribodipyrimidine photo-lyase